MDIIEEKYKVSALIDGQVVGYVTFPLIYENTVVINHTFVDANYRGQNIAQKLMETAVNYIRANGYRVIFECSYAQKWLEKNDCDDIVVKR